MTLNQLAALKHLRLYPLLLSYQVIPCKTRLWLLKTQAAGLYRPPSLINLRSAPWTTNKLEVHEVLTRDDRPRKPATLSFQLSQ